ncbi:MAG TPA: hypothetical protein VFE51_08800 [Verrucomicrobiae bacterium]|nr:hypothetical protein [Verrucomicrobiae bacterium]
MKRWTLLIVIFIGVILALPCANGAPEQDPARSALASGSEPGNLSHDQPKATEDLRHNTSTEYEGSRARLQHARDVLHQATDDAVQGLQQQLKKAQNQLDALAARLEEAARSAPDKTATAARQAEESIGLRARRIEARALLLHAKAKATLAVRAASKYDFPRAEQRLAEATELLRRARATLYDDHAYDDQMDDMEAALHQAGAAVKEKAKDALTTIQKVVSESDRIVGSLESSEAKAVIRGV